MSKVSNTTLLAIACAISIAIALAVVIYSATSGACADVKLSGTMKINEANGCLEFWLNRYQTTIQTAVSGIIGIAGVVFVIRQLKELAHQNQMTREALKANTTQFTMSRQAALGRCYVALATFRNTVLTMQDILAEMAKSPSKRDHAIDFDKFESIVPDVYPILGDRIPMAEWNDIFESYCHVFHFVSLANGALAEEDLSATDKNGIPENLEEARSRCRRLIIDIEGLLEKLE